MAKKKIVVRVIVVVILLLSAASAQAAGVVGTGTPQSCTESALTAALAGGGLVTFNCGPAPHEIALTAQKPVPVGTTTLRGGGLISLSGGNATRLFLVPVGATLACEDIVLRNGRASQMGEQGAVGGAVLVNGGILTMTRSTIRDSGTALTGLQTGGAIESINGTVTLTDSLIEGNDSDHGGGIHSVGQSPSLTLVDTIVRSNRARAAEGVGGGLDVRGAVSIKGGRIEGNTAANGGGMNIAAANVSITDTVITKNAAKLTRGGGILNSGTVTATNVVISDNTAATPPVQLEAGGAGLYNTVSGLATLVGVLVTGNRPIEQDDGGTGAIANVGLLTVHDSVVRDNPDTIGIWVAEDGSATITDTTIANPPNALVACPGSLTVRGTTLSASAGDRPLGTALFVAGTATVENSTITDSAFGVFLQGSCGKAAVTIVNSTIAGNSFAQLGAQEADRTITLKNTILGGPGLACVFLDGAQLVSQGFNIAHDDSCSLNGAGDKTKTDPMIGPLQPNGGPTETHALLPGSPAISGGSGCPATDQRGFKRPQGGACDAGSFEFGILVAAVGLNGADFVKGETIVYKGTVNPGLTPTQVDVYVGAALPGLTAFLSLVEQAPGVLGVVIGPSPVPYRANVPAAPLAVPFEYKFGGTEPVGTYFTYAALITPGGNPLNPANQLSLEIQPFAFAP